MSKIIGLLAAFAAVVILFGTVSAQDAEKKGKGGFEDKGFPGLEDKGFGKGGAKGGGRGMALLLQDDAKGTFEKLDSNKDGKLSRVEYLKVVDSITIPEPVAEKKGAPLTKETLTTNAETVYDALDPEKKNSVTYEQYSKYVEENKGKGFGAGKGAGKGGGKGGKKAPE